METLPYEILYIIYKKSDNIEQIRLVSKLIKNSTNSYFYKRMYFDYEMIYYDQYLIQNLINVNSTHNLYEFYTLKKIYFCNSFNQDIKGVIPNTVKHLTFGFYFNKK